MNDDWEHGVKWPFSKRIHEIKEISSPVVAETICGKFIGVPFVVVTSKLANCPNCLEHINEFPICRIPHGR